MHHTKLFFLKAFRCNFELYFLISFTQQSFHESQLFFVFLIFVTIIIKLLSPRGRIPNFHKNRGVSIICYTKRCFFTKRLGSTSISLQNFQQISPWLPLVESNLYFNSLKMIVFVALPCPLDYRYFIKFVMHLIMRLTQNLTNPLFINYFPLLCDNSMWHPIAAYYILPNETLHLLRSDSCQGLYLNPLGEVVNADQQELDLAFIGCKRSNDIRSSLRKRSWEEDIVQIFLFVVDNVFRVFEKKIHFLMYSAQFASMVNQK